MELLGIARYAFLYKVVIICDVNPYTIPCSRLIIPCQSLSGCLRNLEPAESVANAPHFFLGQTV